MNISVSNAQTQPLVIAALGDSITAGLMRDNRPVITCPHSNSNCDGNGAVNFGGYAPFLATKLTNEGFFANVLNWGYSGAKTSEIVNRVSSIISSSSPTHMTIMLGANDAVFNISSTTVKFNIEMMARNAMSKNVIPILGTVTPDPRTSTFQANINAINADIRELSQQLEVPLADQFTKMNENFALYHSGDLKHFNNIGNEKMADEWFDAIETVLKKKFNISPIINLLL